MKKILLAIILLFFFLPAIGHTAITFTNGAWESTLNCSEWAMCPTYPTSCALSCNGLTPGGGWATSGGSYEQITTAANRVAGAGGRGIRHWLGDSNNNNSAGLDVVFPSSLPEFWIRYYIRFQTGFTWGSLGYYKIIYVNHGSMPYLECDWPWGWDNSGIVALVAGHLGEVMGGAGTGWDTIMAGGALVNGHRTSDGLWHCFEYHFKTNSGGPNGIWQLWIDGINITDQSTVDYLQATYTRVMMGSNHTPAANGGDTPIDYDDIKIVVPTWAGPWQYDAQGRKMIGSTGYTPPSAPVMSSGSPINNYTYPPGTTQATMSLTTNINANCKYDSSDLAYAAMASTFSTGQGTTSHSSVVSGLSGGNSYTRYVRCDTVAGGNPTLASLVLSWNVPSAPVPPVLSNPQPTSGFVFPIGTTQTTLGLATDKLATCKYGTVANTAYASIANTFSTDTSPQLSHLSTLTGLTDGSTYNYYIRCDDGASGINLTDYNIRFSVVSAAPPPGNTLFTEGFEDTNIAARGWYDQTGMVVDCTEHAPTGSSCSMKAVWASAATKPTPTAAGNWSLRHNFTETESVYVSYWIKHTTNWAGSGVGYHPHMWYFLTNQDPYGNLAYDRLNVYLEDHCTANNSPAGTCNGVIQLLTQDGANIDVSNINVDLTAVTENRAIAGCNGDSDGYGNVVAMECYRPDPGGYPTMWWNGKTYAPSAHVVQDTAGSYYKNDWHFYEFYFKLNTILNGIGQRDGIVQMWHDGIRIYNYSDIVFRTGAFPTMKFNQVIFAPYIGVGSPVNNQGFWIDDLTVATSPTGSVPSPVGGISLGGGSWR